jgi:tetratricopeptide (TPR) repeat protein
LLIQPARSQSPIDSIQNIVETTDNDSVKVQSMLALSRVFFSRNLQRSVEYSTQAVEVARNMGSLFLESESLAILGAAHYYSGNYDEALDKWLATADILKIRESQAADSTERKQLMDQRALTLNNIGVVYKTSGEYEKAIEVYQENLNLYEQIGATLGMARSRINIANIYSFLGLDYEKALEYYNESLRLFREYLEEEPDDHRGISGIAQTHMNLGITFRAMEDDDQAIANFQ